MKHRAIRYAQKKFFPVKNSFEPKNKPEISKRKNGFVRYSDVQYANEYPNSFLDIYIHEEVEKRNAPTMIIVHGGGFTWGNKEDGDPFAGADEKDWFMDTFMENGIQVVSIDYAYAPDYLYPTPIIQMGQAVKFLQENALKYGLDMHRVILWGGSAGGQLIGQFANIQTNPDYARKMGIEAVLKPSDIKAMLFNSSLLDSTRLAKTDSFVSNFIFKKCGMAYWDCKDYEKNPLVIQSDVIDNVGKDFPPSFISDGNVQTFYDQARDLAQKLESLKIVHMLNIYPRNEQKLSHGFESVNNEYGQKNMKKMLEFLQQVGVLDESEK